MLSMKVLSNPAIIEPPTGTMKFLSVLCMNASNLPFRDALKIQNNQIPRGGKVFTQLAENSYGIIVYLSDKI